MAVQGDAVHSLPTAAAPRGAILIYVLRRVAGIGSMAAFLGAGCFEDVDPMIVEGTAGDPVCGDGVVEGDETCDDGNEIDGDGCTACRSSGSVEWFHRDGVAGTVSEGATDVAVDAQGRVFVSGAIAGGNSPDIWARAFDGADGTILWTATEHVGDDYGTSVWADGRGGAYVSGLVGGSLSGPRPWLGHFDDVGASVFETTVELDVGWGAAVGITAVDDTLLTVGFLVDGIFTNGFVSEFGSDGVATGREIVVDVGPSDFGWRIAAAGQRVRATAYVSTMAVVAGWNAGFATEPMWFTPIEGAVQSGAFSAAEGLRPLSVALRDDGVAFACATVAVAGGSANFLIVRLADDGQVAWSQQHDAGGMDVCGGVAVDPAGDVVVVGTTAASETEASIAVAKYTASAELVWEATVEHDTPFANGVEVAVGQDGGIFVVGSVGTPDDRDIWVARLVP